MVTVNGRGWRMGTTSNGTNLGDFYIQGSTDDFVTSFINSVYINSSGNVGIGTTSPDNLLTLGTTSANQGLALKQSTITVARFGIVNPGVDNTPYIGSIANNAFAFWANNAERMRIDTSGNVGIGTSSPTDKLSVSGNIDIGVTNKLYNGASQDSAGIAFPSGTTRIDGLSGITFHSSATNVGSQTERMRITSAGDVGIGTSSPSVRLDVNNGAASVEQWIRTGTGFSSTLFLKPNGSGGGLRFQAEAGETATIYNTLNSPLAFGTNNTERFRILSTGGITSADLADAVGYKGVPQNSQTSSYTLALSDIGKQISITTGGVVVPANGSVAFPIGSTVVIYNNSASNQTISITTDTMYLAGTATTGSRTLAQRGLAPCVKVAATTWVISGAGLT